MNEAAVDVVEFLVTAHLYTEHRTLDENDLPPRYRRVLWDDTQQDDDEEGPQTVVITRPIVVTEDLAHTATGCAEPWTAVKDLLFTDRDEFNGRIRLTQPEMAIDWVTEHVDRDAIGSNPTLAYEVGEDMGISYEEARENTRPIHADRVWIDSLLEAYFDPEDEADMLDLVQVKAPEEIEMTLDDLVLTGDQEGEIAKLMKAIEHRDYLAEIGLREIGKILFVGPPGTGKTTVTRALAHELGLPFVEVRLSMITSQYLGETAKNVDKSFEVAKRLAPCILFIDEFDSVAKTRRSDEHAALKRAVNTLLKSIDDISLIRDEVILIGATNHPDQLDGAAWRRFDEIVNFPLPDEQMRADILSIVTDRMEIEAFDPAAIAAETEGLTGSDLRMVMREAVLEALAEERRLLTQADVLDAVADFEERDTLKNMDMMVQNGQPVAGDGGAAHEHDHDHSHGHAHGQ
jgi:ATP-dependent 26S proteasome regulatory subunit